MNTPERMNHDSAPLHWYASAAELYRACAEIGSAWTRIGTVNRRKDVAAHGAELMGLAPMLYHDLHASMNKTVKTSSSTGDRCWQLAAEPGQSVEDQGQDATFRGYAEMLYSGALSSQQASDIYLAASGASSCSTSRYLMLGSPGLSKIISIY